LIDAEGYLRDHQFGVHEDLVLGASIQRLLAEMDEVTGGAGRTETQDEACTDEKCSL